MYIYVNRECVFQVYNNIICMYILVVGRLTVSVSFSLCGGEGSRFGVKRAVVINIAVRHL